MKRRRNNYHKLQKAPEKTAQDQTQPHQEVLQDQNQSRGQGRDQNQSHGQGRGHGQNQGRNQDQNHDQDPGHKVVLDKVVQDEVDQVLYFSMNLNFPLISSFSIILGALVLAQPSTKYF